MKLRRVILRSGSNPTIVLNEQTHASLDLVGEHIEALTHPISGMQSIELFNCWEKADSMPSAAKAATGKAKTET